ncbi:hypothetical protein [Rubrivivax gelatinosus]|uniref:Uncharacterized protein n=1 Tax=Rubrivivax gelatinosus TaxID=28068 RepID=A0ABS1DZJ5_RUBGE|nr:hypothetical protein [Rubrivivax gelatinosus]MBK1715527.1 hypothetical protein [Rubrivivax gelatinosus]
MSSARSPFGALKKAFDAVFRHDLGLQRQAGGVRLVLRGRDAAPADAPSTPADLERQRREQELLQAREDLTRLLDEDHTSRAALRHLAVLEHALGRIGWQALERLPLDVLQRAHGQLEDQVTNWSARGLAGLRSRLAVTVAERSLLEPLPTGSGATELEPAPALAARAIGKARGSSAPPVQDEADRALLAAYGSLLGGKTPES